MNDGRPRFRCGTCLPWRMRPSALILFLVLGVSVRAADPDSEVEIDLSRSLTFLSDPRAQQRLASLEDAVKKEAWPQAAESLQLLFESPPHHLVEVRGVFHSPGAAAERILDQLGIEARAAFLRHAEPAAAKALRQALASNNVETLRYVAATYRRTPSGLRARKHLLSVLIDRGQFDEAAWINSDFPETEKIRIPAGDSLNSLGQAARNPADAVPAAGSDSHAVSWLATSLFPDNAAEIVTSLEHYLRENGISPTPAWNVVEADGRYLVANGWDHRAYDSVTGELLWVRPASVSARYLDLSPLEVGDSNQYRLMSWEFGQRAFRNVAATSMTFVEGKFVIPEPIPIPELRPSSALPPQPGQSEPISSFPATRLACCDAATGNTLWLQPGDGDENHCFLHAPWSTPSGLFVLAETERTQAVDLLCISPDDGRISMRIPVARSLVPLGEDRRRHGVACALQPAGRRFLCQTAAGAVAMVDPWYRELTWGVRTQRLGGDSLVLPLEMDPQERRLHDLQGWQRAQIFLLGDRVVTSAPDAQSLQVRSSRSGELIWSKALAEQQSIIVADEEFGIVVIGMRSMSSLNPATGDLRWHVEIPLPNGRGILKNGEYHFPCREEAIATVNLADGTVRIPDHASMRLAPERTPLAELRRTRNLFAFDDQLVELSFDGLCCLPMPEGIVPVRVSNSVPERNLAAAPPDAVPALIGQRLETGGPESLSEAERHSLLSILTRLADDPRRERECLELIERIPGGMNARAEILRQKLARRIREGRWGEVAAVWLDPSVEAWSGNVVLDDGRRCRLDRWIQGDLLRRLAPASTGEAEEAWSIMRSSLASRPPGDCAAQLALLKLIGRTPLRNTVLFHPVTPPQSLAEWIGKQLALMEATHDGDASVRAEAFRGLIELDQFADDRQGIAEWAGELAALPAETPFLRGGTVGDWLDESARRPGNEFVSARWPDSAPQVTARSRNSTRVFFSQFPVEVLAGGLYSRINLELDWPGCQGVRYSGSSWTQEWMGYLPASRRVLRTNHDLTLAWGLGRLCVLQCGSELFGLSPFEFNGDRGSQRLWPSDKGSIDTLGDASNVRLAFLKERLPERPGYHSSRVQLLNEFGHPAAAVGPVDVGVLCYQEQGMFVALDPATGTELWRRYDLPPRTRHFGDHTGIVELNVASAEYSVLDPVDGGTVRRGRFPASPDAIVATTGCRCLLGNGERFRLAAAGDAEPTGDDTLTTSSPGKLELRLFDVPRGLIIWSRGWPEGSFPVELDHRRVGVLEPSGRFEILESATGNSVAEHRIDNSRPIERVGCAVGRDDLLIAFSGPVDDRSLTNAPQRQQGYRRIYLDGEMLAVDRKSGDLRWRQRLRNTVFPLDQPCDFPVFVTAEARYPEHPMDQAGPFSGGASHGSVLRVYDRRSGAELYVNESTNPINVNYVFHNRIDLSQLVLRTRNTTVEFDFSETVGDPAELPGNRHTDSPNDLDR